MREINREISEAMQSGKTMVVKKLVENALSDGIPASEILSDGLLSGMDIIAGKFTANEIFIPEVLIAARAMNAATTMLKSHLTESGVQPIGKAIIGTVRGDLHDIGKNLVRMMLEGKGIDVIDMGVDVAPEKFLETYQIEKPDLICLSTLLTTTMPEMKNTIDAFKTADVDDVIFMIGGAPVNEHFRESIGADIYAPDAGTAAEAAKQAIFASKEKKTS